MLDLDIGSFEAPCSAGLYRNKMGFSTTRRQIGLLLVAEFIWISSTSHDGGGNYYFLLCLVIICDRRRCLSKCQVRCSFPLRLKTFLCGTLQSLPYVDGSLPPTTSACNLQALRASKEDCQDDKILSTISTLPSLLANAMILRLTLLSTTLSPNWDWKFCRTFHAIVPQRLAPRSGTSSNSKVDDVGRKPR